MHNFIQSTVVMPASGFVGLMRKLRGQGSFQNRIALVALGGDVQRELFALQLADFQEFRHCTLYLSSGELDAEHPGIKRLGSRAVIDYSAVDTLSNFTTLIPLLRDAKVTEIVCITSPSHARRAGLVGRIVLGAYGIQVKLRLVSKAGRQEGIWKVFRDAFRAIMWVATGWTGESVALWVHPNRKQRANGEGQRCIG